MKFSSSWLHSDNGTESCFVSKDFFDNLLWNRLSLSTQGKYLNRSYKLGVDMQNCFPKDNSIFLLFSVEFYFFFFPRESSHIALEGNY